MEEYSISQIGKFLREKKLSVKEVTEGYLCRINNLDGKLKSIIEVNPDALEIANRLDRELAEGKYRGPLHGISVTVKDNIDTKDRMQTTSGSLAMEGNFAKEDAFIIGKLREAGAIILGKANLSEWANFRSTHSSSGWSSRGGQCRNAYQPERSPCGSSSGSAVSVAANFCTASLGTETDGSIVCPAHSNSIVGIKPTVGLLSRSGIIPIASSFDTAGPMARTVEDAALLLEAMQGVDSKDAATMQSGIERVHLLSEMENSQLKGMRIGVARNYIPEHEKVKKAFEAAVTIFREMGAIIVDDLGIQGEEKYGPSELEVLYYEFHRDLNAYFDLHPDSPMRSMEEVVEFNAMHKKQMMPFFGQEHMEAALQRGPKTRTKYLRALKTCLKLSRASIDKPLRKHSLDCIISPSGGPMWLIDNVHGDQISTRLFSSPSAVSGYPHLTVPMSYVRGIPVGLSICGTAWSEARLIAIAMAYEKKTKARRPPVIAS